MLVLMETIPCWLLKAQTIPLASGCVLEESSNLVMLPGGGAGGGGRYTGAACIGI